MRDTDVGFVAFSFARYLTEIPLWSGFFPPARPVTWDVQY